MAGDYFAYYKWIIQGHKRFLEGDGGKKVVSDSAFLTEGPFFVPCCSGVGLNELFDAEGGVGVLSP